MKRRTIAGRMSYDDDLATDPAEQRQGQPDERMWEAYAMQVDREAQRFYEALVRSIRTAEEAIRDRRMPPVARAYLVRIATEAKNALGKEPVLTMDDKGDIAMDLTSRSVN